MKTVSSRPNLMLAGINCQGHIHLVIGTNSLAGARCTQSINAGALPVVIAPEGSEIHYSLQEKIDRGIVQWKKKEFETLDALSLGRLEVEGIVDALFVTGQLGDSQEISRFCKSKRIPINVIDSPQLCTISLLSTHTDGPLQIGVTTNGSGCKLASRIRREIASCLPRELGRACQQIGSMRQQLQATEDTSLGKVEIDDESQDHDYRFNKFVSEGQVRGRKMRWLGQICEYWPLKKLASMSEQEMDQFLQNQSEQSEATTTTKKPIADSQKKGRIILAGSGPGHPDLLTRATYKAMQMADLVLADKLVPSEILDLLPRRTLVKIARKFPGNAHEAQQELIDAAVAGALAGKTVLRLKQGDPFLYGRGGEEMLAFRNHGLETCVSILPGLTSALCAPMFAGIPVTQRDVANQVLICTGTGKMGAKPQPPEYIKGRTTVFLMSLHRISDLVQELSDWPAETPCAVIERATCPDQRVIRTTLQHVSMAVETEGSRPPGLLVVGDACSVLYTTDKSQKWIVEEGLRELDLDDLPISSWI